MTGERDFEKENAKVEKALFQAATGHVVKLKKPVKVKEETNRPGEGKQVTEKLVTVVEQVYVEPKITAQMFWLKSRMPEVWGNGERAAMAPETADVMESYAELLDHPVKERCMEEADGQDSLCEAE